MTGPGIPRPLPGVYEGDAWGQTSGVYPSGARSGEGLVGLLWHEHVHNEFMQYVLAYLGSGILTLISMPYRRGWRRR